MLTMPNLQPEEAGDAQLLQEHAQRVAVISKRQPGGMRQYWQSPSLAEDSDAFYQARLISFHGRSRVIGEIQVKSLLLGSNVSLAQEELGKMRASGKVAAELANFGQSDFETERTQFLYQVDIPFAAALLVAYDPLPKVSRRLDVEEISKKMNRRDAAST
jgi:hypothetical protein